MMFDRSPVAFLNTLDQPDVIVMAGIGAAFLCLWLILTWRTGRRSRSRRDAGDHGENTVRGLLSGYLHYNDLTIRTPDGQTAQIDHVILLRNGGLVIFETKNWNGIVSGGPRDRFITVSRNGQTRQSLNPVAQMIRQRDMLALVSERRVFGYVASINRNATWPAGYDTWLLTPDMIPSYLAHYAQPSTTHFSADTLGAIDVMDRLMATCQNEDLPAQHAQNYIKKKKASRVPLLLSGLFFAAACLSAINS